MAPLFEFKNVEHVLGSIFEMSATFHANQFLRQALPGCTLTEFSGREFFHDDQACEIDCCGYMLKDKGEAGTNNQSKNGVQLLTMKDIEAAHVRPVRTSRGNIDSPNAKQRPGLPPPIKYVLGEVFIGRKKSKVKTKLRQLERSCGILLKRCNRDVKECTETIGAAFIATKCKEGKSRKSQQDDLLRYFRDLVKDERTSLPILSNLAESNRLFVLCLTDTEAPISALATITEYNTERILTMITESMTVTKSLIFKCLFGCIIALMIVMYLTQVRFERMEDRFERMEDRFDRMEDRFERRFKRIEDLILANSKGIEDLILANSKDKTTNEM